MAVQIFGIRLGGKKEVIDPNNGSKQNAQIFPSQPEPPKETASKDKETSKEDAKQAQRAQGVNRPGSLIASRCSAAYRVYKTVMEKDSSLFQPTFSPKDDNLGGNFFQGYRYALMEQEYFRNRIRNSGVLRTDIVDDWMATGGGSCGAKIVELDTMLPEVPQTSRFILNLILSEIASDTLEEPANALNTLLALNLIGQLDKKYRKVLSITFISNSQLMLHSGEMSLEYKRSNEMLAKHFVTERQMNLMGLRLIDLVGRQDSRFSVIGFASTPVKPKAVDNYDALPALAELAKRQLWFKASDMFDKTVTQDNLPLKGGKLIIVIPPAAYASMEAEGLVKKIDEGVGPLGIPSNQLDAGRQPGIRDAMETGTEELDRKTRAQRSKKHIPIEIVKGTDKGQNEIHAICRRILWSDDVEDFFNIYIKDKMKSVCQDASTGQPKTVLGRKFAEFYDLTYARRPDFNTDYLNV